MQIDTSNPNSSKEKSKNIPNKSWDQKRRFINYRREKLAELLEKEAFNYKKELLQKGKGFKENNLKEENKEINEYHPNNDINDIGRYKQSNKEFKSNVDYFEEEILTNFSEKAILEDENYYSSNILFDEEKYNIQLEEERNERIKLDHEIQKHQSYLEMLKQEELIKRKKYQDNLLLQINDKIKKRFEILNNKYNCRENQNNDIINN